MKYPFAVTCCCCFEYCVCQLVFHFILQASLPDVSFVAEKIRSPRVYSYLALHSYDSFRPKVTSGCFWCGIAHPVVCKMKGRKFFEKIKFKYSNSAFISVVIVRQLIICVLRCGILRLHFFSFVIMIVRIVSSKVSLGEGDKNGWITVFCVTLKVNKCVRTQYKWLS